MTICSYRDATTRVKCVRKAVSSYRGKAFCNKHLQELRRLEYDAIDYEKAEESLGKGGS